MKKYALSVITLSLLSGCALTSGEQYNAETRDAIRQSELNINQKLTNIELAVSNQSDYIDSLESEISSLHTQLKDLRKNQKTVVYLTPNSNTSKTEKKAKELKARKVSDSEHQTRANNLVVLGAVESVTIESVKQSFDAKIDTGAETSALNAVDLQEFEREGKKWVRFQVTESNPDKEEPEWFEAPVLRFANIRQPSSDELEKRPVVEFWIQLGKIHEKAQFTLADRSQMNQPILLGREFIRDIALVDVRMNYLQSVAKKKNQS